jgi:5-methylcytosine-specific restriction enzyme subunit McrC
MSELLKPVKLVEYATSAEPVCLSPTIARTIHDRLGNYLEISPAWDTPDAYWLSARQYVGDIIVDDVHIQIHSEKASTANLFWMLTYAYDLPDFRDSVAGYAEEMGLFEFLVAIFVGQVEKLVRHGIHRNYQARQDNQTQLRGQLCMIQQIRRNMIHPERFAVRWSEHTSDILENRLLKHVLLRLASARYPHQPVLSNRLRKAYAAFDLVAYSPISLQDFSDVRYHRLNQHYRGPLGLGRLLWQHLSVRNEPGKIPFSTYLFDLNQLFEYFIAAYLQEALKDWGLQAKPKYHTTLDYGRLEPAEMDIVLFCNQSPVLIIDAKYKTYAGKPAPVDRNQIFTYCQTLGVESGLLLYPSSVPVSDERQLKDVKLRIRGVSLNGTLDHLKSSLAKLTRELVDMASVIESASIVQVAESPIGEGL